MPQHKRPIDATPSTLLRRFGERLVNNAAAEPILDVPCGYGRNATYIASLGVNVVCIDNDLAALTHIALLSETHTLTPMKLDLLADPWPFPPDSVGAIINIHHYHPTLLHRFMTSLKPGGSLYLETIGGQGHNHRDLPPRRFISEQIATSFDATYYKEHHVGPNASNAVSVKLFATKRNKPAKRGLKTLTT